MLEEHAARSADQSQIQELRSQELTLIDDLKNNEGGLLSKLGRWAQIVEELIDRADKDCNFPISQISTYIRRECHKQHFTFAHHVNRYLSEKYKDPSMVRIHHLEDKLEVALGNQIGCKPIEQFTRMEMEFERELLKKTKDVMDKELTRINNGIEEIDQEAINRGYDEIGGEKIRDQITVFDFRYKVPEDLELEELNEGVVQWLETWGESIKHYGNVYKNFPAVYREDAEMYFHVAKSHGEVMKATADLKYTGDMQFWFDRIYWKLAQSTHMSGNSTEWPTNMCAHCSKNVQEDYKDKHIMIYDKTSPTGFRCDNCQGTIIRERNTTREQVSDSEEEVLRKARDVLQYQTHKSNLFNHHRDKYVQPAIESRKDAIAENFSKSAFGKEKLVISRKNKGSK